jgi:hypothetical protein
VIAALIDDASPARLRRAVNRAVEALWDHELQAEVRAELTSFQRNAADLDDELTACRTRDGGSGSRRDDSSSGAPTS